MAKARDRPVAKAKLKAKAFEEMSGASRAKRGNEEWGEGRGEGGGKRKRRLPVRSEKGEAHGQGREERREKRKCYEAWERASPLTERGHAAKRERGREGEDFTKRPVRRFHPHRKPTPTFTLAARPDDSMFKDGRLAG